MGYFIEYGSEAKPVSKLIPKSESKGRPGSKSRVGVVHNRIILDFGTLIKTATNSFDGPLLMLAQYKLKDSEDTEAANEISMRKKNVKHGLDASDRHQFIIASLIEFRHFVYLLTQLRSVQQTD
ncbi:hypothetical protein EVAR_72028_1 [Eumeta japonica]|uniref:Uncharacterized protein n=1 Tax=Eumeta variegata TaxID=151549 RepID=A0A4C1TF66_EUMVA|nr:hypothetical protein EVAR_72028_1 [Eumeta japonica]